MAMMIKHQPITDYSYREDADPIAFLPSQFFPVHRQQTGVQSLILSLLQDLVLCLLSEVNRAKYARPNTKAQIYLQEDLEFILGEHEKFRDYPLSFTNCCLAIGLDPDVTRAAILQRVNAVASQQDSTMPRFQRGHGGRKGKMGGPRVRRAA
jgi:hypothetical protein